MDLPNGDLYRKLGVYQLETINGMGAGGQDLGIQVDLKMITSCPECGYEKSCTFQNRT